MHAVRFVSSNRHRASLSLGFSSPFSKPFTKCSCGSLHYKFTPPTTGINNPFWKTGKWLRTSSEREMTEKCAMLRQCALEVVNVKKESMRRGEDLGSLHLRRSAALINTALGHDLHIFVHVHWSDRVLCSNAKCSVHAVCVRASDNTLSHLNSAIPLWEPHTSPGTNNTLANRRQ